MSAAARMGLVVLALAAVFGVLADWLLRPTPVGLGATLWALALVAATAALARWRGRLRGSLAVGVALAPLFALCLAWRDSPILAELDVVALVVCFALAAVPRMTLLRVHLDELGHAALLWIGALVTGLIPVVGSDIPWRKLVRGKRGAARVMALAVPVILVAGVLFVAARAHRPVAELVAVLVWGWLAAGLLRVAAAGGAEVPPRPGAVARLGALETLVVLGLVDLLFVAFVAVQLRSFVGGRHYVTVHIGLSYADYARTGFFQLAAVAALAVGLLLALDSMLRRDRPGAERAFRLLGGLLVLLVLAVLAMALHRMQLYRSTFGWTGFRFYTAAFIVWLGVVLLWLAWTVLRGRRERFAGGVLLSGLVAILALNAVNPDAIVARADIDTVHRKVPVDYEYLGSLSDDAVPTIVAAIPKLQRDAVGQTSFGPRGVQYHGPGSIRALIGLRARCHADWRTWNRARARARKLLCPTRRGAG